MKIALTPGQYVVAVSGGVDSAALLHALQGRPEFRLTVAHFDHGIRPDSDEEVKLTRQMAQRYGLPFVYERGELGSDASEAAARQARYAFLHKVRASSGADALVTAHHRDDVLETAVMNIVRGTGRRGLTSLRSTDIVKRPLLHVPKADIVKYARDNQLVWREDQTNRDTAYRRNYIRHNVLKRFTESDKSQLHDIIRQAHAHNSQLDDLLTAFLDEHLYKGKMPRYLFVMLPHKVASEVMAAWLRREKIREHDKKMIERLVHASKTFPYGRKINVNHNNYLFVEKDYLALKTGER